LSDSSESIAFAEWRKGPQSLNTPERAKEFKPLQAFRWNVLHFLETIDEEYIAETGFKTIPIHP
jgi:hypothetical protein